MSNGDNISSFFNVPYNSLSTKKARFTSQRKEKNAENLAKEKYLANQRKIDEMYGSEAAVKDILSGGSGVIGKRKKLYTSDPRLEAKKLLETAEDTGEYSKLRSLIKPTEESKLLAAAQKEIERLTLRAPFAGLIEADTAELGSLLQPGGLCSTIIQLDPIKVVGFVAESDMPRVKVGSMAAVSLLAGQNTIGSVSFLSRSADKQTRTFQVDIDISNKDGVIAEGQTADIMIQTEGTLAHLIPQSALTLNDDGDLGVRIITDQSKALFVPIGLLRDTEKGVWLAGLPKSASVIIRGQEYVVNGVLVDAIYEELTQ